MTQHISHHRYAEKLVGLDRTVIEQGNDATGNFYAEDYILHWADRDLSVRELERFFTSMRAAFPNLAVVRPHIMVEGQYLAFRAVFSGTFRHTFVDAPGGSCKPTGEQVIFESIGILRFNADDLIAEEWVRLDNLDLLQQLGGTLRSPVTAAAS